MADRQLRTRVIRALGGAAVAAALLGAGTALAANQAVAISGFAFAPKTITVAVGDTVTWTNSDSVTHTATANDASWNTGNTPGSGGTGAVTFTTAGTFPYHCAIHSSMTGSVTVLAAGATPAPGSTTPPTDAAPTAGHGGGAPDSSIAAIMIVAVAWAFGMAVAKRRLSIAR